jgi:hypothetical protein
MTKYLEELRARHEAGDKSAVMWALNYCFGHRPVPEWAIAAFKDGCHRVLYGEARSWSDVFGEPNKGKHLGRRRHKNKVAQEVFHTVCELHQNENVPMTKEDMFAEVGKRVNLGSSTTAALYYDICHELTEIPDED